MGTGSPESGGLTSGVELCDCRDLVNGVRAEGPCRSEEAVGPEKVLSWGGDTRRGSWGRVVPGPWDRQTFDRASPQGWDLPALPFSSPTALPPSPRT